MSDLAIRISSDAELAGIRETIRETKLLRDAMAEAGNSTHALDVQLSRLRQQQAARTVAVGRDVLGARGDASSQNLLSALTGSQGAMGTMARELQTIAAAVPGLGGLVSQISAVSGPAAGAAVAITGLAAAVHEYAQAEQAITRLDAAMATAGLLTDANREKYQALATELQRTTKIADEQWMGALARLTEYGSRPEMIGMDVEAVKNLAAATGDIGTATMFWAQALQGNMERLHRYTGAIDDNLSATEKLRVARERLAERFGGQTDALGQTLSGQFAGLKNSVGDFMEAIGGAVSDVTALGERVNFVAEAFSWWANMLSRTRDPVGGLTNAVREQNVALTETQKAAVGMVGTQAALAASAKAAADGFDAQADAMKRAARAADEQESAEMALLKARVDADERAGRITSAEAIARRAGIDQGFAASKYARDQAMDAETIRMNEQRKFGALDNQQDLQDAVKDMERNIALSRELAEKRKNVNELQAKVAESEKSGATGMAWAQIATAPPVALLQALAGEGPLVRLMSQPGMRDRADQLAKDRSSLEQAKRKLAEAETRIRGEMIPVVEAGGFPFNFQDPFNMTGNDLETARQSIEETRKKQTPVTAAAVSAADRAIASAREAMAGRKAVFALKSEAASVTAESGIAGAERAEGADLISQLTGGFKGEAKVQADLAAAGLTAPGRAGIARRAGIAMRGLNPMDLQAAEAMVGEELRNMGAEYLRAWLKLAETIAEQRRLTEQAQRGQVRLPQ